MQLLRGTVFDNIDFLANNIMLPLGGLAIVMFAGWAMARNSTADELDPNAALMYRAWHVCARFVAPVAIALVMLNVLGILPRVLGLLGF
jgi:NSS family neurotransmitter:Na+ symporter